MQKGKKRYQKKVVKREEEQRTSRSISGRYILGLFLFPAT